MLKKLLRKIRRVKLQYLKVGGAQNEDCVQIILKILFYKQDSFSTPAEIPTDFVAVACISDVNDTDFPGKHDPNYLIIYPFNTETMENKVAGRFGKS